MSYDPYYPTPDQVREYERTRGTWQTEAAEAFADAARAQNRKPPTTPGDLMTTRLHLVVDLDNGHDLPPDRLASHLILGHYPGARLVDATTDAIPGPDANVLGPATVLVLGEEAGFVLPCPVWPWLRPEYATRPGWGDLSEIRLAPRDGFERLRFGGECGTYGMAVRRGTRGELATQLLELADQVVAIQEEAAETNRRALEAGRSDQRDGARPPDGR